ILATYDVIPQDLLIKNFQVLNELIYSDPNKFIQSYKVLTNAKSANIYRVIIEATVVNQKIQEALSKIITASTSNMPKILIAVSEQTIGDKSFKYFWDIKNPFVKTDSEQNIAEKLKTKGFTTIMPSSVLKTLPDDLANYTPELDNKQAIDLANMFQAEVIIIGKAASAIGENTMGSNLKSLNGNVNLKAFRVQTGEEIAASNKTATIANSNEVIGGKEALKQAVSTACDEIINQIISLSQNKPKATTGGGINLEILVEGASSLAYFEAFTKALKETEGVKEVKIKEMGVDANTLAISFKGISKSLAEALMTKQFEQFGINIYEVSDTGLKIKIIPKN
ncbi:MAG: hypothetical protein HQK78_18720, partial [Desulfobacterales bacterium]|nr:hypothetical protein [Desulfobacterales bacterium]